MAIVENAMKAMESMMDDDTIQKARQKAEQEILSIRLAQLRERQGVKQTDFHTFSQTAVSKLEKRKDMKLSTLIEYLENIGMGLEIRAYPKGGDKDNSGEVLLKV